MDQKNPEEQDWLDRARAGDGAAFGRLVGLHQQALYGFIWSYVRDSQVADDLTQESFVRAWRGLGGFRGESAFRTWLFQIGLNRVRSWSRWSRLRQWRERSMEPVKQGEAMAPEPVDSSHEADPTRRMEAQELGGRLRQATNRLPPREKEVFLLRHDQNFSVREVSLILKIAEGSVKAHLHHAMEKLRRELESSL